MRIYFSAKGGGTGAGGLDYLGTWNANTNTPAIASGIGTNGQYYIVSVAGTTNIDGINSWDVNDWIIFNGTAWQKIDNSEQVQTITLTGDVTGSGTGSFATTIANGAVTNAKMAQMPANTVKANATAAPATPQDVALTASTFLGRVPSVNGGNLAAIPTTYFTIAYSNGNNILYVSPNAKDSDGTNIASDSWTRSQAIGREDRPFITITACANASLAGDIIIVNNNVTENVGNIKANCLVVFDTITYTGNIFNSISTNNVILYFLNSTCNGVPNPNNNVGTGTVYLQNSIVNAAGQNLIGTFATRFIGIGKSSITCAQIGGNSGSEEITNVTINGRAGLINGVYKDCNINGDIFTNSEANTGILEDVVINNPSGNAINPINGGGISAMRRCRVTANRLYNDINRTLKISEILYCNFTLTNSTSCGAGGTSKMSFSTSNLTEANFKSNMALTSNSNVFSY